MLIERELSPFLVDPKVYKVDEHRIPADKIDQHAYYVIQKLCQAGHKAYLVGGGVRDLLLNHRPKDFDVSTSAKPEEIKALFRSAILIGRRFRLAHVRFGKKIIEVSTFRAGETESAELIVRDNEWGSEEQDVLRRDFTINGLFYDLEEQTVIDYVGGFLDLERKILKTIGKPETRFIQDPVRMIRLVKFSARFDLEIEPATFEALLSCKKEILKSSAPRVLEELLRMLESGASKPFFHLLHQYGLLKALLPELSHFFEINPEHKTFQLLEELDSEVKKDPFKPIDRSLLLSVLIFPLFHKYLDESEKKREKSLHLGQIANLVDHVIHCTFHPFFQLPKRLKSILVSILTSQYRIVPLNPKNERKPRIPRDSSFPLALDLLKIRSTIDTHLLSHYTLWSEASFSTKTTPHDSQETPRRRRGPRGT